MERIYEALSSCIYKKYSHSQNVDGSSEDIKLATKEYLLVIIIL